jgi:hypothetical protein
MTRTLRLPLRVRAVTGFGITAFLLGVALALLAHTVIRGQLTDARTSSVVADTFANARAVRAGLRTSEPDVPRILDGLQLGGQSVAFVQREDRWYASDIDSDRRDLPKELRDIVADGRVGRQRVVVQSTPMLVVGVPIREVGVAYYQTAPLADIDRTLKALGRSLGLATALATAVAVLVGIGTTSAVLRPLRRVTDRASPQRGIANSPHSSRRSTPWSTNNRPASLGKRSSPRMSPTRFGDRSPRCQLRLRS